MNTEEQNEFRTYSADIALIRGLHKAATVVDAVELTAKPLLAAAKALGLTRVEGALEAVRVLDDWGRRANRVVMGVWRIRYGGSGYHQSRAVRALALNASECIGSLDDYGTRLHYRDVFGIPVAADTSFSESDVFYAPADASEILGRARAAGSRWILDADGGMSADAAGVPSILSSQTREAIDRVWQFAGSCRGLVLWGPPRGGKSVAARQISEAVAGGWVRVCSKAAASPGVWETIHELQPAAVILDDLDTCANGDDDALLAALEKVREYARVIITTVNILPGESGDGSHDLRGAVLAPGRAADEQPLHYGALDADVRAALAPSVPEDLRAPDLLAAYLVELQTRAEHLGTVTQSDVDEMRARMAAVGDR